MVKINRLKNAKYCRVASAIMVEKLIDFNHFKMKTQNEPMLEKNILGFKKGLI